MKHCITILILLISPLMAINARTIQGVVLSSNDSTAVAGATCRIISEGKLITGVAADAVGAFLLETNLKTSLNLEVSMTGYSSTDVIIDAGSKNVNIGTIYLDQGVTLDDVTVTGNQVVHSKGRTIVYPSSSDVRASSTSVSLFQKLPLPGLQANPINRTLSVDGGSPVILINGVPSTMDDVNALQPKDIEKIEYSRFIPARYADSGKSGYVSIILKKRNDGGQFYAWGRSAVNTAFVDGNVRASYHQGPSQLTLLYNPSWRNYQQVYDDVTESLIGDDFKINLEEHDRNPFNYQYHAIRLKYDFSPSAKTLFSATFSVTPNTNKRRTIAHTIDSEQGEYDNNSVSSNKALTPTLDLFLHQDFNDKNSLEVQVVGTLSSSDYRRDNNYIFADGTDASYIMNVDSRRRSLISEVSYIHNFSDKTSISAGYQNTVSHSKNTYLSSDYKPILTENNNYAYVRLGQNVGKFYFSLSTGAKLFWIKNDLNKRNFIRNISSAQVSWNISSKWNLQATFRYTPEIPSLSALTDYPQQTTPYLISNGNPDLKVAENFMYSIAADYTYKKFQASFRSNYFDIRNSVISDVQYLGDDKFMSQSINAKYRRQFQNDLWLSIRDIYGFGARLYMSLMNFWTAGANWNHKLTSFSGGISVWWNKGPFTVSYWREIPGTYLSGHYKWKGENGDSLSFEWRPDKHWTVGASWMYMFDKKGTRYPSWDLSPVNPSTRDRYIKNNSNMVVLSVSYTTDFGSIFRSVRRNLNNSDNGSSLLQM